MNSGKRMSSSQHAVRGSLVVFEAVTAARNARAFFLFLGSAAVAILAGGLFLAIAATMAANGAVAVAAMFSVLGWLTAAIIISTGVSATGKVIMDHIQGRPPLSTGAAILAGLATLPKLLAVFAIELLLFVTFMVVLALVLFVCKIPVFGPLLYTVVYPVASVVGGLLWFTFGFVVNPLAAPAFWEGYGVGEAMALLGVGRRTFNIGRLLSPVIQQLFLMIVVMLVAFIASAIVFGGSAFVAMLAAGILGFGRTLFSSMSAFGFAGLAGLAESGFQGYFIATLLGAGLLAAIAYTFPLLVYLAGVCNVFLNLAEGGAQSADDAKTRESDNVSASNVAADTLNTPKSSDQQIQSGHDSQSPVQTTEPRVCRACGTKADADDVFCGECGADLR
jgi:hypothetical protein